MISHDITHCYGGKTDIIDNKLVQDTDHICELRDTCFRYKMHLRVQEMKGKEHMRIPYYLPKNLGKDCELYTKVES